MDGKGRHRPVRRPGEVEASPTAAQKTEELALPTGPDLAVPALRQRPELADRASAAVRDRLEPVSCEALESGAAKGDEKVAAGALRETDDKPAQHVAARQRDERLAIEVREVSQVGANPDPAAPVLEQRRDVVAGERRSVLDLERAERDAVEAGEPF